MNPSSKRTRARDARHQQIIAHVVAAGVATIAELTELTGASVMTIHRDLDELARRGIVRKFHGGVSAQPSTVFESSSDYRLTVQSEEKEALAAAALRFVEPGMSLMIDDSTSALGVARLLGDVRHGVLTVVTNYLPTIEAVREFPDVHLIAIGGDYSPTHDSFLGIAAVESIAALTVDVVFLSTSAMTPTLTFHQEPEIILVKRAMMAAAQRRVLLMDPTKLRRRALHRLAPTTDFEHVVLNDGVDPQFVRELRERVDVVVA
jgi:DeoR/GlpR family transcriptional regulator of sugar metabolism